MGAKLAATGFARVLEEEEIAVEQEEVTAAIFTSEELKRGCFYSWFYSIGVRVSLLMCTMLVLRPMCFGCLLPLVCVIIISVFFVRKHYFFSLRGYVAYHKSSHPTW